MQLNEIAQRFYMLLMNSKSTTVNNQKEEIHVGSKGWHVRI